MRWKMSAGVLVVLALVIPAAPAMAQTGPGLDAACQTVERTVFKDLRELVTIDLDTATDTEVRVLADQILAEVKAESLPVLSPALQEGLDGTEDDLRAFLKTGMPKAWYAALRVSVTRTLVDAGTHVKAAAGAALDDGDTDTLLAYLNEGLYAARALDCASEPTTTPSATATATSIPTTSASPGNPGGEGGEGGGLPVTGANIGALAGVGGALLLLGGVGYLIGRRRRSTFVA
ncbi:LPXTG cell wall anchor domain-containing protein [Actinoplanes sp. NPDC026623]|uniref:LPXTG cell wall anchor domain-containing protein n=1 Tax=Actinoplanes sp. NPDC026623 TaxID=3155610 RepID=UPI00340A117F